MEKIKLKKEIIEKILNVIKFLVIVFAISIFACQPYLNNMLIYTHDLGYHLNRIIEISKNLNIKVFPSFIHSGLLKNLGYANSIFYPEIFLYIPAILMSVLDLHVLTVYKIFLIIITFFTFITTYISSKGIFKKKEIAWLTSLLYVFSLYRLTDIYVRGALGEILSFIFVPLIFYGLYEIIFGENKKWWIISIGLFGVANSHVLTFVMLIPIILLIALFNIDKLFKDKKKLFNLVIAGILSIILCIGFFGPMLEQKLNDEFYIDGKSIESSEIVKERSTALSMALGSNIKSGYAVNSTTRNDGMSEGIGAILLIFAGLTLCRKGISYKENRFEIQVLILGVISYFMTTTIFPWEKFEFLNVLQFPFRLNFIPSICFALIGAKSFYEVITNKRDSVIILSIVILIISGYVLSSVKLNFNPDIYQTFDNLIEGVDHETGSSEYLPVNSDLEDLELYNINDKEEKIEFTQTGSKIEFEYNEKDLDFEINIPLIYYKGYKANIVDLQGNKTELEVIKNNDNGHVLIKSDKKLTGTVTVEYKMTDIQGICYSITIITFIGLIIYIFIEYRKNKKLK